MHDLEHKSPLIAPERLAAYLGDEAWRIVDTRHDLGDPGRGRALFEAARLPGATFLSIEADLSARPNGRNGRHPWPTAEALAATLGRAGICREHIVVVYDQGNAMFAGRLWGLLRWLGHETVYVLDGGFEAWLAAALPLETGPVRQLAAGQRYRYPDDPERDRRFLATAEEILARLGDPNMLIVDARAPERYRGEQEPIDPVAGHIPGAVNWPFSANLRNGRFKPAAELAAQWRSVLAGRDPTAVVHQCGSGVSALANMLAMEHAGLTGSRLYPGSWSEWCADPRRPIACGG
ncbi:MAG: sulfurtransferase [Casimicrobiaceae bacterium]|nr:sulfurtransferase [Casimicrobiaceae bacterium]MDW8312159.1 sulfurtransferase [Burkholderiales bacterium]